MRLRYHKVDVSEGEGCVSLLSLEPQMRTIYTMGSGIQTLPWPYLIFLFQYTKVEGGFLYGGLYKQGLRVFLKSESLLSFDDKIAYAPTEHHGQGLACTDHGWDNAVFKTPEEV